MIGHPTQSGATTAEDVRRLHGRLVGQIRRRLTWIGATEGACLGLLIGALGIAAMRTGHISPSLWWALLVMAAITTVSGAIFRRITGFKLERDLEALAPGHTQRLRLERAFDLVHSLRRDASSSPTAHQLREARDALETSLTHVHTLQPEGDRAPAWRRPPDLFLVIMVGLALLAVGVMPLSDHDTPQNPDSDPAPSTVTTPSEDAPLPDHSYLDDHHHRLITDLLQSSPPHWDSSASSGLLTYPRADGLLLQGLWHHLHLLPSPDQLSVSQ